MNNIAGAIIFHILEASDAYNVKFMKESLKMEQKYKTIKVNSNTEKQVKKNPDELLREQVKLS